MTNIVCSDSVRKLIQLSVTRKIAASVQYTSSVPRLSVHMHFLQIWMYFSMSEFSGSVDSAFTCKECNNTLPRLRHPTKFVLVVKVEWTELTTDMLCIHFLLLFLHTYHICTYDNNNNDNNKMNTFLILNFLVLFSTKHDVHLYFPFMPSFRITSFSENVKIKHLKHSEESGVSVNFHSVTLNLNEFVWFLNARSYFIQSYFQTWRRLVLCRLHFCCN